MERVGELLGVMRQRVGSQRRCGVCGRDHEPVDLRKRAEGCFGRNEKIAEQSRVGRGRRRHVDEEAVKRLRLLGRRQHVDVVAVAHRPGFRGREHMLVAHHERGLRP